MATRTLPTSRAAAAAAILGLAIAALIAPQSATAAVGPPVPAGVYVDRPWVEPGGTIWAAFVGSTTECGDGYNGFTFDWSFRYSGGEVELLPAGFGEGPFIYRAFTFRDTEDDPLPIGQSAPVDGEVVLTCTPTGGGAANELTMPLVARPSAPPSPYRSPTGFTFHTPGDFTDGAVVTVNALGFEPGESVSVAVGSFEAYSDSGDWSTAASAPVTVTADGAGAVTAQVTLPTGWDETFGATPIVAGSESYYMLAPGDIEPFAGEVGIDATEAAFPGGAVSVEGSGYYPSETVKVVLHSSAAPIVLGTLTADGTGSVRGIVSIPASVPVGDYRLWAGASVIDFAIFNSPLTITAKPSADRLSGPDRFQTAVAISSGNFAPGVDTVYLANGLNFPDALSAGALAAQLGAPVVLTAPTYLPDPVRAELNRLQPDRIVIVGGQPSVSSAVQALVEGLSFDPEVVRFAGANRFETNRMLIEDAHETLGDMTVAYISNGLNFPDALAAAPAAASKDGAVVLVNGGASSLDSATINLLSSLGVTDVFITGDTSSVSAGIQTQLNSIYPGHVTRFAGVNRFDTAARIVAEAWPEGADSAILSNGLNFPDALAAGALGQPLLTSLPTCIPDVVLAQLSNLQLTDVTLVGDANSLNNAVRNFTRC